MFAMNLLALVTVFLTGQVCWAFPGGAPRTACSSMNPIHMLFSAKEATDAPYVVVVETASVKSLKATDADKGVTAPSVTVMIKSTSEKEFKGFLIQARQDLTSPGIGTFTTDSEGKVMDCGDGSSNAVTHNSRSKKTNQSVQWTPPLDFKGQVTFVATIVEGFRTFYTEVKSIPVTVTN